VNKSPRPPETTVDSRESVRKGHGAKSDAVREQAILALLSERSIELAAKRTGIGERTLRTWLSEDADFKTQYEQARQATFDAAMSRIQALSGKAIDTLEQLLSERKSPSTRLGAARTICELAIHRDDAHNILKRLDEIEAAQRNRRP
jgi:hypothetical protein